MKVLIFLLAAAFLSSCGTVATLSNNDAEIAADLNSKKTRCEAITRVYSSVAYDFCQLHAHRNGVYFDGFIVAYLWDMALSTVADTVVLPYSVVAQAKGGSIEIKNP